MPALPDIPNTLKIQTFFSSSADTDIRTRWYFTYSGTAPTDAVCNTIAADCMTGAAANLPAVMNNDTSLTKVQVTDLTSPTAGNGEHAATHAGTRGSALLPAGACVLVNQPILRRYRGGKPRTYWPFGVAGDLTTTQTWLAGSVTNFTAAIQLYLDAIFAISESGTTISQWVNVSYYQGFTAVTNPITGRTKDVPKVRSVAIAPDVISTFSIHPNVASQRRRNLN